MNFVSCDPGLGGALALWYKNEPYHVVNVPVIEKKSKRIVDLQGLAAVLGEQKILVIEKVSASPQMGATSAFNFGAVTYSIMGVAAGLGMSVYTLQPVRWKTHQGLLKKPKENSRQLAIEKFPAMADKLTRKSDADRAEALLIGDTFRATGGILYGS